MDPHRYQSIIENRHPQSSVCPWCRKPLAAGTIICVACGYNRTTKKIEKPAEVAEEAPPPEPPTWKQRWAASGIDDFWDWEVPLGLIAVSFVLIALVHVFTEGILSLPLALLSLAFLALVSAGWMYAGMCVMELMSSVEYGDWRPAMLKLFSISCLWYLLGTLFEWRAPGLGFAAFAVVAWPIEFLLVRWMFTLDSFWTLATLVVIALTQAIVSAVAPG